MKSTGYSCRSCGGEKAHTILDMGLLPLANAFVSSPADTADSFRAQQTLVMCDDCRLVQLRELVDREELFRNYLWVTGTSVAAANHARWLSARLAGRYMNQQNNLLVEIASNDGFFLRHYRDAGFDILGVDPSNVAGQANDSGLPTIQTFFGKDVAEKIIAERGQANIIVARNVLGHSSELRDLVEGASMLLAPGGRIIIEHPYAYLMRSEVQYDQIFHEHASYPTVQSLSNLISQFGLKITEVTFVDMNGGSMLVEISNESEQVPPGGLEIMEFENFIQLNDPTGWREFSNSVIRQKQELVALLRKLKSEGKTVAGYGAAAKSMVMLNYCGIDLSLVNIFADANPSKQGLSCPGVRIPVVSPDEMLATNPDYILIGAWNLKKEIIQYLREEKGFSGKFIIPLPLPSIQ
ncbi:MAG: SAM-dependent methyltransferase [Candidatus Azotimanducaceae bacterium]|jgi:SAM-dependent methyltransferase